MAIVEIPSLLRPYTHQQSQLTVDAQVIMEIILNLINNFPELKKYLINEQGHLNSFISIYLNGKDVRHLEKESTIVNENDIIMIVPAISGG